MYTLGWNESGQLGHAGTESTDTATFVSGALESEDVLQVMLLLAACVA